MIPSESGLFRIPALNSVAFSAAFTQCSLRPSVLVSMLLSEVEKVKKRPRDVMTSMSDGAVAGT